MHIFQCMLERKDAITNEVLEPIAFFLAYPTVYMFLGALSELREVTVSFVLSVRMEQLGSLWKNFHEIWCLSICRKSVAKNSSFIKI